MGRVAKAARRSPRAYVARATGVQPRHEELMMRRSVILLLGMAVAIPCMIWPAIARAQARRGPGHRLVGTVKDALGRPLPDAKVSLQGADGSVIKTARSSGNGTFSFAEVRPGTYAVTATLSGFRQGVEIVTVSSGRGANLEIALQAEAALSLNVVTTRINRQPNGLSKTGNSQY